MPFEGSGVDTTWKLDFPSRGNPAGLDALADVLLTFYTKGFFSPTLYADRIAPSIAPTPMPSQSSKINNSVLFSANKLALDGFRGLRALISNSLPVATLIFDLTALFSILSRAETQRRINNVALLFVGSSATLTRIIAANAVPLVVTVGATAPAGTVVSLKGSARKMVAWSNSGALAGGAGGGAGTAGGARGVTPALNVLHGEPAEQTLSVVFRKSENTGFDALGGLRDVVLWVGYEAD